MFTLTITTRANGTDRTETRAYDNAKVARASYAIAKHQVTNEQYDTVGARLCAGANVINRCGFGLLR